MSKFSRWFYTVRHLRLVQFYSRLWFRLYRPAVDLSAAPPGRPHSASWVAPIRREQSLLRPFVFRFLNEEHALAAPQDWDNPGIEKLWRYNLHYFDDLNAEGSEQRSGWHREWLDRWMRENPPAQGSGWEPYPTSLRIVNWIKWTLAGNELPPHGLHSLAVQVRWLGRRLEIHLLGNHLLANAKALAFAGLFFEGEEAELWLRTGLRLLAREVKEQILGDGGHFERSPMYHALVLEDLLDLLNLAGTFPETVLESEAAAWHEAVLRMRRWLAAMVHPDGEIAFFNDATFGIAPVRGTLENYAERLGCPAVAEQFKGGTSLAASGYIRVQNEEIVALLDVAPVGPDYLPGHAHADTLSFELSLFGQRVIVNSGISCYGSGAERVRQRGTAAHSTVEIDGMDSSEVWGGFRVAQRAWPMGLHLSERDGEVVVRCAHDGYKRLPGRPIHRRTWRFKGCMLEVTDVVEGKFQEAVARYYFHPEVKVEGSGKAGNLVLASGKRLHWRVSGGRAHIAASRWYPGFGLAAENHCLQVKFESDKCRMELQWN